MVAPNPLAARRRTNSSSFSVAVPSSWEESVVSGAIANRFAVSRPQLNLKGDQTTIDQTSDIPQAFEAAFVLVPGITNWYCSPSFETAASRPPQSLTQNRCLAYQVLARRRESRR